MPVKLSNLAGFTQTAAPCGFTQVVVEGELVVVPHLDGESGGQLGLSFVDAPEMFLRTNNRGQRFIVNPRFAAALLQQAVELKPSGKSP